MGEKHKCIKSAVILAAGENEDFDTPVGFLSLENQTLIQRSIDILQANGIEKIIIVAGHKREYYHKIKSNNIQVVDNLKYKWTGTMYSLALAERYINEDFILLDGDLVFENRAIKGLLECNNSTAILIASESGSGDEAFVEIRDRLVYKISKERQQLRQIDGEMIGVSVISLDIFHQMIQEYIGNRNPYLSYEYILLELAKRCDIGYIKIDGLAWSDIDNIADYKKVHQNIWPQIKKRENEQHLQEIRQYIKEAFAVRDECIGEIVTLGGMTNTNYKVTVNDRAYVLRYPGKQPMNLIDRKSEKNNSQLACELGLNAYIAYFNDQTGIKIAEFIDKAETLNPQTAKREENMVLIAGILRQLHDSPIRFHNTFDVFEQIEIYENILAEANSRNFTDYNDIKCEVMSLRSLLEELGVALVPCHNDTVPENFIKNSSDKIYLIDWEYSGMNDPMWDLAAHFLECGFSVKDEELFLNIYFDGDISEKDIQKISIYKVCQDFLWSLWTNIKEAKGADFGTYGIDRYNRAKLNLAQINLK
jgi:thiamine kinase-like enzyme/choline kinase